MKVKLLIIGILIITTTAALPKCNGSRESEIRDNLTLLGFQKANYQPRNFKYTTPKGAKIESVDPVSPKALEYLDRGLQRRVDRFRIMFPAWAFALSVAGTEVLFLHPNSTFTPEGDPSPPCSLESIPGAPCLFVKGIKTAGTVVGTNQHWDVIDRNPILVLPSQAAGDWQWLEYLAAAAHNEDEHRAGFLNVHIEPTGLFYHFLGADDTHPWQWGEPVPYLHRDAIDDLIPQIPHACLPQASDKEIKKAVKDQLGIDIE